MSRPRLLHFTSCSRALKTSIASWYTLPILELLCGGAATRVQTQKAALWHISRLKLMLHPGMFHLIAVTGGQSTKPRTFQSKQCRFYCDPPNKTVQRKGTSRH